MNKTRLNLVFFLVLILSGLLVYRLYQIQIVEGEHWESQAERQREIESEVEGERGEIYAQSKDEETIPLATNKISEKVYVSPNKIRSENENKEEITSRLSNLEGVEKEEVMEKLKKENSSYEVIKEDLSKKKVELVKGMEFSGVRIEQEVDRFYPQRNLGAQVVGFVGGRDRGQYGIEGYYEDVLRGMAGVRRGWRSPSGEIITEASARQGLNLELTLDYNIQFVAETILEESIEEYGADSGTIIAGNPKTGEIWAIANYPTFDPNNYSKVSNVEAFKNNAIQSFYEPGSVFKPITMAAAIEEDVVSPQTTFYDEGYKEVSGHTIKNYNEKKWEEVTMTEVIKNSINTGTIYAQQELGNDTFLDYLEKFKIFEKTDIDLQGETYSENRSFKEGYAVNFANASFGQGIKMTPIQLFNSFMPLANGGEFLKPYLAENFNAEPEKRGEVISTETASKTTSMLIKAAEEGNAHRAKIPGYHIAAKTGTAQVPWSSLGEPRSGYSDETIQTVVGYGPALDAEFLILVKLDHPDTPTAGLSAAPTFRRMAEYIIDYKQIPPDYKRE